jgi:2-polyprenyl-6-methoxyphenol hydroxylase-like FAD-dependent oxidoreductase
VEHIVIVGGGVAGLMGAVALGRDGHRVTVIERDPVDVPPDPDAAFSSWPRRGAPQVHHSHAFLARLRDTLRDRAPDLLRGLLDVGVTEIRFADDPPPEMTAEARAQLVDDDVVALACRRTTFEWVLRRSVLALEHVELVEGAVDAFAHDGSRVTGVVAGATTYAGDLVVDASGPRSTLPARLEAAGLPVPDEQADDTGIIYSTRFYRLGPGVDAPIAGGPIAGDLGYAKYAVFAGDNRTFSITFGLWADDAESRALLHEEPFTRAAAAIPALAPWVAPGLAQPITGVEVMARLVNRRRRFVRDDRPLVRGLVALGDAAVCTNPLYGRGCSLATVHAFALADVVRNVGIADLDVLALAFDEATRQQLVPWFDSSLMQDSAARAAREAEATGGTANTNGSMGFVELLRDGVLPAARTDPIVWRAFLRVFNLLDPPDALMRDGEVMQRVLQAFADREHRPAAAPLGPPRDVFFAQAGNP